MRSRVRIFRRGAAKGAGDGPESPQPRPPTSRRVDLVADIVSGVGDFELVAIDDADRDFLYDRIAQRLQDADGVTLIRLDASGLGPEAKLSQALLLTVHRIGLQVRAQARAGIEKALADLENSGRFQTTVKVDMNLHVGDGAVVVMDETMKTTVNTVNADGEGSQHVPVEQLAEIAARATRGEAGRIVLLVDHAEWYTTGPGRHWMEHYRQRANAQTVIRMLVQPAPAGAPRSQRRELPPFDDADVQDLMRLGVPDAEVAASIRAVTGNQPWLIHIVVSQLTDNSLLTQDDLRQAVSSGASGARVWEFLSRFAFVGDRSYLGDAVERMSLLRNVDRTAVEAVVRPILPPDGSITQLFTHLREVHLVDDDGFTDGSTPGFALLAPVVQAGRDRLATLPEARQAVHRLAADHYRSRVDPIASDDAQESYLQYWYRFESPDWLADLREWIHHSRHTAEFDEPRERRRVRLKLTRWFLEGFFWYEIGARHRFCAALLEEWAAWVEGTDEERNWLGHLVAFHRSFGRGAFPDGDDQTDWTAARRAISRVRTQLGAQHASPPEAATDESVCFAIAMYLEAEVVRMSGDTAGFPHAERLYTRAHEWLVDDDWARAWAVYERVGLALAAQDPDLAAAEAEIARVAAIAETEEDRELQALTLGRQAEIWLRGGSFDRAAQALVAALAVALQYQTKQEQGSALTVANNFPNEYSRQLYLQVDLDAAKIVEGLRTAGRHDVERRFDAVCDRLFHPFQEVAASTRAWPAAPRPEDLDREDTEWLDRALRVVEQGENLDVLTKTVATPMPWFAEFAASQER